MIENIVIIGGGPAGLSSALYLSRAGLKPLLFAGSPPGGQLMLTTEVENFPGFSSILGPELIVRIRDQAVKFGARLIDENVVKVNFSQKPFFIETNHSQYKSVESKIVLVATGAKALWLNLPSEQRLRGKGVSACATCDGFFFKDKIVAVVGGGDTACEEALTLTKFAKKVYLIHRRNQLRASKIMQERVFKNEKIKIIWNSTVEEVLGENKVEGIRLKSVEIGQGHLESVKIDANLQLTSTDQILKIDGLFVAIGHKPDTDIFKGQIELDEKGYVITVERAAFEKLKFKSSNLKINEYRTATSVKGVFAAGDCVDHLYRQAITASGMGVMAALEIERWLGKL